MIAPDRASKIRKLAYGGLLVTLLGVSGVGLGASASMPAVTGVETARTAAPPATIRRTDGRGVRRVDALPPESRAALVLLTALASARAR